MSEELDANITALIAAAQRLLKAVDRLKQPVYHGDDTRMSDCLEAIAKEADADYLGEVAMMAFIAIRTSAVELEWAIEDMPGEYEPGPDGQMVGKPLETPPESP